MHMIISSGNLKQLTDSNMAIITAGDYIFNKTSPMQKVSITEDKQAVFSYGAYGFPCELFNDSIDDFYNGVVDWHWQLELEFSIVEKGSINLVTKNDVVTVREGEGYIVFPNQLHKIKKNNDQCGIYHTIIISPEFIYGDNRSILFHKYYLAVIDALSNGFMVLRKDFFGGSDILSDLASVIHLLNHPSPKYELDIHTYFLNIWSTIYDHVQNENCSIPKFSSKDEAITQKILLFIHTNYQYDISLCDIARSGNISKSECSRLFQRVLFCTPFEYLTHYRISKSQEYLCKESYSITQIAGLVGYNSVNYYTTVFRKYLGYTPSQYKKQLTLSFSNN